MAKEKRVRDLRQGGDPRAEIEEAIGHLTGRADTCPYCEYRMDFCECVEVDSYQNNWRDEDESWYEDMLEAERADQGAEVGMDEFYDPFFDEPYDYGLEPDWDAEFELDMRIDLEALSFGLRAIELELMEPEDQIP